MIRGTILIVLFLAVLALVAPATFACSCSGVPRHHKDFREAKAVFIGQVTSISEGVYASANLPDDLKDEVAREIRFKVGKNWKGAGRPEIVAWLDKGSEICSGLRFRDGEKWLVYAYEFEGILIVHSFCSRTRPLETQDGYAEKEFKQLNSSWFRLKARLWPF